MFIGGGGGGGGGSRGSNSETTASFLGRPLGRFVGGSCGDFDFDDDGNDGRAAFLDDVAFLAGEGDCDPLFLPPDNFLAGVGMILFVQNLQYSMQLLQCQKTVQ